MRRMVLQLRFSHDDGRCRPVAASRKQRGAGARVTLELEPEARHAPSIFVLYREGGAEVAVAGSVHRDRVEAALHGLGEAGAAYRIANIPVEDESAVPSGL